MRDFSITVLGGILTYLFKNEISNLINYLEELISDRFFVQASLSKESNGQSLFALKQYLMEDVENIKRIKIIDGNGSVFSEPAHGKYLINDPKCGYLCIDLNKDGGTVYALSYYNNSSDLKTWQNDLMKKYCSPQKDIRFYMINNNKDRGYNWQFCTTQPLIKLNNLNQDYINNFKASVKRFIDGRARYAKLNKPYRYGYLLHGPKGNYKTLMSKWVASEYGLPIYNLNLTSSDLSDNDLEKLLARVPAKSIILLDELDIMLENVLRDERSKLTQAGLQKALAGPIDLKDGTIVIITTNNYQKLIGMIPCLCREGRIDESIRFGEKEEEKEEKKEISKPEPVSKINYYHLLVIVLINILIVLVVKFHW